MTALGGSASFQSRQTGDKLKESAILIGQNVSFFFNLWALYVQTVLQCHCSRCVFSPEAAEPRRSAAE